MGNCINCGHNSALHGGPTYTCQQPSCECNNKPITAEEHLKKRFTV